MLNTAHFACCIVIQRGFNTKANLTHPEQEVENKEEVFETHCDPVALLIFIHAAHLFCWREEKKWNTK